MKFKELITEEVNPNDLASLRKFEGNGITITTHRGSPAVEFDLGSVDLWNSVAGDMSIKQARLYNKALTRFEQIGMKIKRSKYGKTISRYAADNDEKEIYAIYAQDSWSSEALVRGMPLLVKAYRQFMDDIDSI